MGLPHVLIEARDAHPLVGGSLVNEFWTDANGSFSACLPYDAQGYTFISVYQEIGSLNVLRDGGNPPGFFPNMFGMVWDLNRSPTIPLNVTHPEIAFALHTWYRGITEATLLFGVQRSHLTSWYYGDAHIDYYCPAGFIGNPFGPCDHFGENIYTHRYAPGGYDNIWTPYGQFTRIHEYGHGFAHETLNDRLNYECSGSSHDLYTPNNLGCAVSEGWADFFAAVALPVVKTLDGDRTTEVAMFPSENW